MLRRANFNSKRQFVGFLFCLIGCACARTETVPEKPVGRTPAAALSVRKAALDSGIKITTTANGDRLLEVSPSLAKSLELKTEEIARRTVTFPLHVSGRIEPDFGKEVDVSTRVSGRIKSLEVHPGDLVQQNQVLAVLDSKEIGDLEAELVEAKSKLDIAQAHEERERQIYHEQLQRPKNLIEAQTDYQQAKVQKELSEADFKRVDGLYKEKISPQKDYLVAKAKLAQSTLAYQESQANYQREQRLYANKGIMKRDYQLASAEKEREQQHLKTLRQRLIFLGVTTAEIKQLMLTSQINGVARILAPSQGFLSQFDLAVGESVYTDKSIFKITDLSVVMVRADVPESDLAHVHLGAPVRVKVTSYPNETFTATISYISDHVNPETKKIAVRARLPNPQNRLKTDMTAEIDLESHTGTVLSCPRQAIQTVGQEKVVFIKTDQGLEERRIKEGNQTQIDVEVLEGLKEGDQVVTQGSLALKEELSRNLTN